MERRHPNARVAVPHLGLLRVARHGLPDLEFDCLEFNQAGDWGFGVPVRTLVGYPFDHLLWLERAITDWLEWHWRERR